MIQNLTLLQTPEYHQKLRQCIHCGLCLQACPTYLVFGTEMDAPRGRIALMRAVSEARISLEDFQQSISPHLNLCLACRSCETACPSGVKYGELVETARVVVETNRAPGWGERILRRAGLNWLMPHLSRLKFMARLLKIYQALGLQAFVRRSRLLPGALKAMEGILPPINTQYRPETQRSSSDSVSEKRVLFFTGCIQEAFLSPVNRATERVLTRNGYQVLAPSQQTCCGAAHLHLGELDSARRLARKNIDAFLDFGDELIVTNAGGCGLSLKEYPHLLRDDPLYADRARLFASRVQDVTELLGTYMPTPPRGEVKARVTYADSCHLRHGQKVVRQPRDLVRAVPGVEFVDLAFPDQCCGSAGVYNIAQSETAEAILHAKLADVRASGAQILVTTNTGCHMQLMAGVRREDFPIKVMHLVELLDLSYANEDHANNI